MGSTISSSLAEIFTASYEKHQNKLIGTEYILYNIFLLISCEKEIRDSRRSIQ